MMVMMMMTLSWRWRACYAARPVYTVAAVTKTTMENEIKKINKKAFLFFSPSKIKISLESPPNGVCIYINTHMRQG